MYIGRISCPLIPSPPPPYPNTRTNNLRDIVCLLTHPPTFRLSAPGEKIRLMCMYVLYTARNYAHNSLCVLGCSRIRLRRACMNCSYGTGTCSLTIPILPSSVADPGCLSGSRIRINIPDSGSEFFHPGSASKNLSILTPKNGF